MKIFTPCWGEKHIELVKSALGKSLSWPKNRKHLIGAHWIFVCSSREEGQVLYDFANSLCKDMIIKVYSIPDLKTNDSGQVLMFPLRDVVKECLVEGMPLLMATPDFIFSDGTIDAFKELGKDPGSCVSIAHIRVLPEILKEIGPLSNSKLVSLANKYPHISWSDANNRLYRAGIKKYDLGPIQAVQHYMPSPFFCNFFERDLDSFSEEHELRPPGFGMWDHVWPKALINDGRLRYIGSSDLALLLEATDADKNVPPLNQHTDGPGFFKYGFHNKIQKQFVSVFRGD